jgi:hypothetical protein
MYYSVKLINSKGEASYLSVKNRTSWKTKRIAVKHKRDIEACKHKPFDTVIVELENEFGDFVKS